MVNGAPQTSTGSSAVTGYVIKTSPCGKSVNPFGSDRFLVGGLVNGTACTFTVARGEQGPDQRREQLGAQAIGAALRHFARDVSP